MISHTTQRFRKEFKDLSKSVQRQKPKPLGQPTRGKTAPNRLRKTDTFLGIAFPDFVRRMTGLYVDLGYGAYPVTSVETLRRLRRLNQSLRVLGVEIDPQHVAEAQPFGILRLRSGQALRASFFPAPVSGGAARDLYPSRRAGRRD